MKETIKEQNILIQEQEKEISCYSNIIEKCKSVQ